MRRAAIEGEMSGGGPAGRSSSPFPVAYRLRCLQCRRNVILLSWEGYLLIVGFFIALPIAIVVGNPKLGGGFAPLMVFVSLATLALGIDLVMRVIAPGRPPRS